MKCEKCGGSTVSYSPTMGGGPIQVECEACGNPPKDCVCPAGRIITMSRQVNDLMNAMDLKPHHMLKIEMVYSVTANLGEYGDFLPDLKGRRYRRMLYEAIEEDISRHIWEKDWEQKGPMPEGFRP